MHSVLTVDLSAIPAEISLSHIDGNVVAVAQNATVDLGPFVTPVSLKGASWSDKASERSTPSQTEADIGAADDDLATASKRLLDCLSKFEQTWTSSVVVVPAYDFIALNLSLPFGDSKNLNKIIDLEIQDVVPFEIDEFLVQYRTLSDLSKSDTAMQNGAGRDHDVHVGLIPRTIIKNVIELSHRCELEPVVVASPSSAIAGVFQIAPEYFKDNSAVISFQPELCSLAIRINGEVRAERILQRRMVSSGEEEVRTLFSDLRLSLSSIERRYGIRIEHIYVLGQVPRISQLQQALARPVEHFTIRDVIRCDSDTLGPGPLASIFAREEDLGHVLTNFRVREFSYSPRFTELLTALKSAGAYFSVALVMAFVALGSYFGANQYKLRQEEIALVSQITQVMNDFVPPPNGDIIGALRARETQLSDELGALGSPSRNTPLDAFASISKDLPTDVSGLQINSMKIRSGNATFDGVAPDLSAVDKVEKALQLNKAAYKKVTSTTGAPAPKGGYRFTVDIILNQ